MRQLFPKVLVVLLIVFSFANPLPTANASDISGHLMESEVKYLDSIGVMKGDGQGNYFPERNVSRQEFAAFIVRALKLNDEIAGTFTDVKTTNIFYSDIHKAAAANLIAGYPDGTYKPTQNITREEMATIMYRILRHKGIEMTEEPISFKDTNTIQKGMVVPIQNISSVKLISGFEDNTFRPKAYTVRAHAAALISRMLQITTAPTTTLEYSVSNIDSTGELKEVRRYSTFTDARNAITSPNSQVVMHGKQVAWMSSGIAYAGKVATIYTSSSFKSSLTYVSTGTEMIYHDATKDWVKVTIANLTGYAKAADIILTPSQLQEGRSFYSVSSGDLVHSIYQHALNNYVSYKYGKAPSFMVAGQKYYSWDGNQFYSSNGTKVGNAYQYYNYLPLYSPTKYTAEDLNRFVKHFKPDSPFINLGQAFKDAETKYGVNALYLLANAIHESNWGLSNLAKEKNNLFGWSAYDSSPLESGKDFESMEACIEQFARDFISKKYLVPGSFQYNGPLLGNKEIGMNVRYASDPYWGQKIAGHMYRAAQYLGNGDLGHYTLGAGTQAVNMRSEALVSNPSSANVLYQLEKVNYTVAILEEVSQTDGVWYKVTPRNLNGNSYPAVYIFGNGTHGTLVTKLPVAK
ncbi:S-layer homology domain-containing protein [Bacillus pinisoli]|uniref:S-layer homology domain-containing protein n=1 Tax=Bacillus pinisoli TaxID=2901866 RepID=UPI001FF17EB8|nr:S-layer homology domain-containing protein [Bacillus pinisoli]